MKFPLIQISIMIGLVRLSRGGVQMEGAYHIQRLREHLLFQRSYQTGASPELQQDLIQLPRNISPCHGLSCYLVIHI